MAHYPSGNYHIPFKGSWEDDFPFPRVGYVSYQEGTSCLGFVSFFLVFFFLTDCIMGFITFSDPTTWEKIFGTFFLSHRRVANPSC